MRRINILLFLLLITLGSYAQNILVFDSSTYPVGIVHTGDSIVFSDNLYNDSSTTYSATLGVTFQARVNTRVIDTPLFSYSPFFVNGDTFAPGVRYSVTFKFPVDTSRGFIIGPNTIVIWPVYYRGFTPFGPVDSVYIYTTYDTLSGIAGTSLLRMYIFQTPGHLNVNFGDAENLVQQVRICDILGQSIYAGSPERSGNIPTTGWNTGIYLCEITTFIGEKRTIKFRLQ